MAQATTKLVTDKEDPRLPVKKGDRVRLLLPLWDGVQMYAADEIIYWPLDTAPVVTQACLPDERNTALDAPPMQDGTPPANYVDARTGQKLEKAPTV